MFFAPVWEGEAPAEPSLVEEVSPTARSKPNANRTLKSGRVTFPLPEGNSSLSQPPSNKFFAPFPCPKWQLIHGKAGFQALGSVRLSQTGYPEISGPQRTYLSPFPAELASMDEKPPQNFHSADLDIPEPSPFLHAKALVVTIP